MIPPPTVLATLPSFVAASGLQITTAPVQNLSFDTSSTLNDENSELRHCTLRKERREVIVTWPGGSVQVYDLRSTHQATSYTAPPDADCICALAGAVISSNGASARRRITVAALQLKQARKSRLVLWEERSGRNVPLKDKIRMFQREVKTESLDQLDISLVPTPTGNQEYRLIGVSRDCQVYYWNEELREEAASAGPLTEQGIKKSFIVGLDQAAQGILKGRNDIVTIAKSKCVSDILVSLTQPGSENDGNVKELEILLHGLRLYSKSPSDLTPGGIDSLATIKLTQIPITENPSITNFYNYGSRLYIASTGQLLVYDLTRTTPHLSARLGTLDISSLVPISETVVAVLNKRSLNVLDTKYQAILSSSSGNVTMANANGVLQNETEDSVAGKHKSALVMFCASLGVLVAVNGCRLLIFQVEERNKSDRLRKSLRHSTLADAVGRGLKNAKITSLVVPSDDTSGGVPDDNWPSHASKLEALAQAGSYKDFDGLARDCLGAGPKSKQKDNAIVQMNKADYILSKIFTSNPSNSDQDPNNVAVYSLSVRFQSPRVLQWLSAHRRLSKSSIEASLKRAGALPVASTLDPVSLISAFANTSRLDNLRKLVTLATDLDARELLHAVKIALQFLQQKQNLAKMKLLTEGTSTNDQTGRNSKGDLIDRDPVRKAGKNASGHLELDDRHNRGAKHEGFERGLTSAHDVIRLSIGRLSRAHPSTIPAALAAEFKSADLFVLIDYLRLALAQRGWFSRYVDFVDFEDISSNASVGEKAYTDGVQADAGPLAPPGLSAAKLENTPDPFVHAATQPIVLLSAALDALGAQGWILGKNSFGTTDTSADLAATTLAHMRAEIGAALEGVEEAAYLSGLLTEVLTFAGTIPTSSLEQNAQRNGDQGKVLLLASRMNQNQEERSAPGGVIAKDRARDADIADSGIDESHALPLGLTYTAPGGQATWFEEDKMVTVKAGGEAKKRTMRDVGRMKSMRVGAHSFERIVL